MCIALQGQVTVQNSQFMSNVATDGGPGRKQGGGKGEGEGEGE